MEEKKVRTPWDKQKVADEIKAAAERLDRVERIGSADGVLEVKERLEIRRIRRMVEDLEEGFRVDEGASNGDSPES